jgi:predicted DNA-binding transcriptional regulator YafY
MDSLLRYFDMLSMIPRQPNSISTPDLLNKLLDAGYLVDIRTLQRDLDKLSASHLFPITNEGNTKPLRWQWPSNTKRIQLPTMTSNEALTFKLVQTFLEPLLPPSIRSHMADYFHCAENVLHASPLATWFNKVQIIPNSLSLQPPEIDAEILAVIYEALLKNHRLKATYHAVERDAKTYEVNPLGLVFRHNVIYLVATIADYHDIKQLALHRFVAAELTNTAVNMPDGFSLAEYIKQGEFDYPTNDAHQTILTKFKISPFMKQLLQETPLSDDQRISPLEGDLYLLEATVKNTEQLRWWIRSFSTNIEVLEPIELRAEFTAEAKALNKMYR